MAQLENSYEYIVRKARLEDLDQVISINEATLPEHYPRWFWEEHVLKWGDAFYVAEISGKIVGYVMCRVEWGFGILLPGIHRRGHVISIAVLPEYRRRGIATSLMNHALTALRDIYKCREVYLEVRVSNIPAIKLYEKLGFRKVKVIKAYYADGEDAYLMAREL